MEQKSTTPMKAIRHKCLDCCCGSANEVKLCPAENCPLHLFRLGKNPNIARRELTDEQRQALKSRLTQFHTRKYGKKTANSPSEGQDTSETKTPAEPSRNSE